MSVVANMAMSLDGFIADSDEGVGDLFGFYSDGDVPVKLGPGQPEMRMRQPSAGLVLDAVAATGSMVVGRRLYDHTNGWGGHPPGDVPMVVLTHHPPDDWPRDGVPIEFATGIEAAVTRAVELGGAKDVSVSGATAARACLEAGLLDVIDVSLVPVILGAGSPWFAGVNGPVRLTDPEVTRASGVTHLRYRIRQ